MSSHYLRIFHPAKLSDSADPGLRLGSAPGADLRHASGLDDGREHRSENHWLLLAGGPGLRIQIPLVAGHGSLYAAVSRAAARLAADEAAAAAGGHRGDGFHAARAAPALAGGAGGADGLLLRLAGYRVRRLEDGRAASRRARGRCGHQGAGLSPGDAGFRRAGAVAGGSLPRLAGHVLADGRIDADPLHDRHADGAGAR